MSLTLQEIFQSDGVKLDHRVLIKLNENYDAISACTNNILTGFLPISGGTLTGSLSATSISATSIFSGSTDLSLLFAVMGSDGDITRVQDGINTFTAGTGNFPSVNVTGLSIDNLTVSGTSDLNILSAETVFSGGFDLFQIVVFTGDTLDGGTF